MIKKKAYLKRIFALSCMLILLTGITTSCVEKQDSEIIGVWIWEMDSNDVWLTFDVDGTGQAYSVLAGADEFTWIEENGKLTIELIHDDMYGEWVFSIDEDVMIVTQENGREVEFVLYREVNNTSTSYRSPYLADDFQIQDFIDEGEEIIDFFLEEMDLGGIITIEGRGNEELIYIFTFDSEATNYIDIDALEIHFAEISFGMQSIANNLRDTWGLESLVVTAIFKTYEGLELASHFWMAN